MLFWTPLTFIIWTKTGKTFFGGYHINVFKSWLNYIVNINYLFWD